MGLDIGYYLYEKKPLDDEGKYIKPDIDTLTVCGKCDVVYSWGNLFEFINEKEICPVFQEGLKNKKESLEEYSIEYKLVDFNEFKKIVTDAITETKKECAKDYQDILKQIKKAEDQIKELRELQRCCTKDQEFAFDKWTDEISELKNYIDESLNYANTYYDTAYAYNKASAVIKLLAEMEKYLKEDKYYIIPYYND